MENTSANNSINCKNCDTSFVGNFCPNCGQSVKDYEKPFGLLIYDLMGNIFAFDTRLWKTMKAVLFQPGKMAGEFILGHRVRYMPPFRFYVFVSFVFFLLLNYSTSENLLHSGLNDNKTSVGITLNLHDEDVPKDSVNNVLQKGDSKVITSINDLDKIEDVDGNTNTKVKEIIENPKLFLSEFFKYLSWILFFLMPLYGSLLWLFFRKSYQYYLGHLIFAINQHSFLFIIFTVMLLLKNVLPQVGSFINGWLIILVPVYSVIGAHRLYKKKWLTVFGRLFAIFLLYGVIVFGGILLAAAVVVV